jgi:hypothetical protein
MKIDQPKTLIFDIENAPMLVYLWQLGEQHVGLNNVKIDWSVLAWGAKWLGDPAHKMIYMDTRRQRNKRDDRKILKPLWKLLDQADIVITQNGKNFDSPKLNARFIQHGMRPPSPYKHWDTYQVARRVAKFTSNGLAYLSKNLNTDFKKLTHRKFPGMALWDQCLEGNREAWTEMELYNNHDVLSTEGVYLKLLDWAPKATPKTYTVTKKLYTCQNCGNRDHMRAGPVRTSMTGFYQQNSCPACGSWQPRVKVLPNV